MEAYFKKPNSNWVVFGEDRNSGISKDTGKNVLWSDNKVLNTLYGPDNKPLAYLMEKPVVKMGFQGRQNV